MTLIIYLEFSPTGKYLFSSDWDGMIGLWDITKGSLVKSKRMGG
jgi:WD40 repeat protein